MNKCLYCESTDTTFCSLCNHWFCDKCRKKYPKRITDAIKERIPGWLTREEYNAKKKEESND